MSLEEYCSKRGLISGKVLEIPDARYFDIVTTDHINKYSDYIKFLANEFNVPLTTELVYVKEKDIIESEHFLKNRYNIIEMLHKIYGITFADDLKIRVPMKYPYWLWSNEIPRYIADSLYKLQTTYFDTSLRDLEHYDIIPIFEEHFDDPAILEKAYIEGDVRIENGKLILPPDSFFRINFNEKLGMMQPYLYLEIDTYHEMGESVDLGKVVCVTDLFFEAPIEGAFKLYTDTYIYRRYIGYWFCSGDLFSSIYIYKERYITDEIFEKYLKKGEFNIKYIIFPNQMNGYLNNDEFVSKKLNYLNPYGIHKAWFLAGNWSTTDWTMSIDYFRIGYLLSKPHIATGTPVYAEEWQKKKACIFDTHKSILDLYDMYKPDGYNVVVYDDFDTLPSSRIWDRHVYYTANVTVRDSKLIIPRNGKVILRKNVDTDIPLAIWFNCDADSPIQRDIYTSYLLKSDTERVDTGVVVEIIPIFYRTKGYYRGSMIYDFNVSVHPVLNILLKNRCPLGDELDGIIFISPLREITYIPTKWHYFEVFIENKSPANVNLIVDEIGLIKLLKDTFYTEYIYE